MNSIIIISAVLACTTAFPFPGFLVAHETPVVHTIHTVPLTKSTITKSSLNVNHGGTTVFHSAPVVHSAPLLHSVPVVHSVPLKSTITKSSQLVNHGSTHVLHPVHTPVVHAIHTPVVHAVHSPVVHHTPVVALKTGASAVSHSSQSVHETVPVVKSFPVYHLHH